MFTIKFIYTYMFTIKFIYTCMFTIKFIYTYMFTIKFLKNTHTYMFTIKFLLQNSMNIEPSRPMNMHIHYSHEHSCNLVRLYKVII